MSETECFCYITHNVYRFNPTPPPPHIESGGTYARSPSPEPPLHLGKRYAPYLGYWLPLAIAENTQFLGLSREIFPRLPLPPPKKKKKVPEIRK